MFTRFSLPVPDTPVPEDTNTNTNTNTTRTDIEILATRTSQELYEIVAIIGEVMPRLPRTGLFAVDEVLRQTHAANHSERVRWQWRDEREVWRPYTAADSHAIESAYARDESECLLSASARSYVLDFAAMVQINEETGTARPIARTSLHGGGEEEGAGAAAGFQEDQAAESTSRKSQRR